MKYYHCILIIVILPISKVHLQKWIWMLFWDYIYIAVGLVREIIQSTMGAMRTNHIFQEHIKIHSICLHIDMTLHVLLTIDSIM